MELNFTNVFMSIYVISMIITGVGFFLLNDQYGITSVLSKKMKDEEDTEMDEEEVSNYLFLFSTAPILNTFFAIRMIKNLLTGVIK